MYIYLPGCTGALSFPLAQTKGGVTESGDKSTNNLDKFFATCVLKPPLTLGHRKGRRPFISYLYDLVHLLLFFIPLTYHHK